MRIRGLLCSLVMVLSLLTGEVFGSAPVAVSPGGQTEIAIINQECPTFSWSGVEGAISYRVEVFELIIPGIATYEETRGIAEPVVSKEIGAPSLSWTPSLEQGLESGKRYVWYVGGIDNKGGGSWSEGKVFEVNVSLSTGTKEVVEGTVREYLTTEYLRSESYKELTKVLTTEVSKEATKSGGLILGQDTPPKNPGFEGNWNTFFGMNAGANTTGDDDMDTFIGAQSGISNTTGYNNTFLGRSAGYSNTEGFNNTFLGDSTGYNNTTSSNNTFIGAQAGICNTDGTSNTFLGGSTGYSNTSGSYNSFLGRGAGYFNTTGDYNTFLGSQAGYLNTTGENNTFVGVMAGGESKFGNANTFLGFAAGYSNTNGASNTFLGNHAGRNNTSGSGNVFLGNLAGYNETGYSKLYIANSDTSTPLIYGDFYNKIITIHGKLGIGTKTPQKEIDLGGGALTVNGADNSGQRPPGLYYVEAGRIDFGYGGAGGGNLEAYSKGHASKKGQFRFTYGGGDFGSVEYWYNNGSNYSKKMWLTKEGYLYMSGGAYTNGAQWIDSSSREQKEAIESLTKEEAADTLMGLEPVKFAYKTDPSEKHVGFIAEDVPDLIATKDRKGLSPMDIVAVLTKVVQEQQKTVQKQQAVINTLIEKLTQLEAKIESHQTREIPLSILSQK